MTTKEKVNEQFNTPLKDEEKASELAEIYCKNYASENTLEEDKDLFSSFPECKKTAMLMAKWKDDQFQNYLQQKITETQNVRKQYGLYSIARGHYEFVEDTLKDILKTLYKK